MKSAWKTFLKKRLEKEVFTGLPLTIFAIVFLIMLATFVGVTNSIVNGTAIVKIDDSFAHSLYLIRTPFLAKIFYIITNFAGQLTVVILALISIAYTYFKKELAYLYSLIIIFLGTDASVYFIKILINRSRPPTDIAYYIEKSQSFPSGHSAIAMAFFGFLTYYLIHHEGVKMKKSILLSLGAVLIGLIGFSRLYLGVHFLSDVIGGFLMGGLWLVVGMTFREQHFYTYSIKKGVDTSKTVGSLKP